MELHAVLSLAAENLHKTRLRSTGSSLQLFLSPRGPRCPSCDAFFPVNVCFFLLMSFLSLMCLDTWSKCHEPSKMYNRNEFR